MTVPSEKNRRWYFVSVEFGAQTISLAMTVGCFRRKIEYAKPPISATRRVRNAFAWILDIDAPYPKM